MVLALNRLSDANDTGGGEPAIVSLIHNCSICYGPFAVSLLFFGSKPLFEEDLYNYIYCL
jgi:hypothetical protein